MVVGSLPVRAWTPRLGGTLEDVVISPARRTEMNNIDTSCLTRVGTLPGFVSHPKGFTPRPDFGPIFDRYGISHVYHSPSYSNAINLEVFSRYSGPSPSIDSAALRKATHFVYRMFSPYMTAGLATHEEVMHKMEGTASPGYPEKLHFKTKAHLFETHGSEYLRGAFPAFLDHPWQGIFVHFLKEEIRKVGKHPHGILAGPLDLQYVAMRIFLHQNEGMYESHLRTWSAVGISRDGMDWHRLYRKLARFPIGGCSDITGMDARACAEVLWAVCSLRKRFYRGSDATRVHHAIHSLYEGYINSLCLVNNELWMKHLGLPTGIFNTSSDTTLEMALYLMYAIITVHPEWTYEQVVAHVEAALYGDDNCYTYDPAHQELAPEQLFPIIARDFALEVKSEGSMPVEEFDFLSAWFQSISIGNVHVMVPLFNVKRLAAHLLWGPKNWTYFSEFQRVAMIRQVGIWDDEFVGLLEDWLVAHKDEVSPEQFAAWVPSREVLRTLYLVPKRKEALALNGPAALNEKMSRGSYTKNILTQLEDAKALTPAGSNYLKMALDPFPDLEHPIVGRPDGASGRSYVQQFNQTITITAPPGLPGASTWDCHICMIPELIDPTLNSSLSTTPGAFVGVNVNNSEGVWSINNPATIGNTFPWRAPLMAVATQTGNNTMPNGTLSGATVKGFDLTGYVGPQSRVIGGGFEVVNTTAELYLSGAVVYYTQPSQQRNSGACVVDYSDGTASPQWGSSSRVMRAPPNTLGQAMSIPGSVKRLAKEGAYVPLRQAKGQDDNPPLDPQCERVIFENGPQLSMNSTAPLVWGFGEANPKLVIGGFAPISQMGVHQPMPFDISGAYFTGLNVNSTLDVTLRLYIEGFPTPAASQTLVSLTVPCPPEDPLACEIYSRVCASLPPGVPVSENADGTWWRTLLKTIASVAPTVGSALGSIIPGGGLIGSGVGKAAEMLAGMSFGEKAQKKIDEEKKAVEKRLAMPMQSQRRLVFASPNKGGKAKRGRKAKAVLPPPLKRITGGLGGVTTV